MKSSAFANRYPLLHQLLAEYSAEAIPLDLGACAIASPHRPSLNPKKVQKDLDLLADRCRDSITDPSNPDSVLEGIRHVLFSEIGFCGNENDYYSPENSFIDRVLETRKGIPITLSIIMMEIAKRLGVELFGIGLPCHFMVGHHHGEGLHLYDPFHGGDEKSIDQCIDMIHLLTGGNVTLSEDQFVPASPRSILVRMLMNLRGIYRSRHEAKHLVAVLEELLVIGPDEASLRGELAASLADLGNLKQAHQHFEAFSHMVGKAPEVYRETDWVRQIRTKFSAFN